MDIRVRFSILSFTDLLQYNFPNLEIIETSIFGQYRQVSALPQF